MIVTVEDDERVAVGAELQHRLMRFNEARAGALNREYLVLALKNDAGELCGGLSGEFLWNALYVSILWIDEGLRGQGHGTRLLAEAERRASARGCEIAYLSTFSFQAPEFYPKRGYEMVGELPGVPSGSSRRWFAKSLRAHA